MILPTGKVIIILCILEYNNDIFSNKIDIDMNSIHYDKSNFSGTA